MDEPVDSRDGHGPVGEDLIPAAEGLVGGDGNTAVFVAPSDQFEEDAGFGLILVGISDVVKDDQVELVEFGEGRLENEVASGSLEPLHQIAGPGVEDAMSGLHQSVANGAQDVRLAGPGISDGNQVAAAVQPIACRQSLDTGAGQGWQGLEVEGCQCLAGRKLCFVQMVADAAHVALGEFIFRQNGEETGSRPAFGVGAGGNLGPELVEAGQPERGQHAGQRVDVDLAGGHALAPRRASKLSSRGGRQPHPLAMLWPLAPAATPAPWAPARDLH